MKKLLIAIILSLSLLMAMESNAQSSIGFQIAQGITSIDNNYGLDLTFKCTWNGKERNIGYWRVGAKFEIAVPTAPYKYYGAEFGFKFHYLPIPFTEIKYQLTPFFGYGGINRISTPVTDSYEIGTELSFKLNDKLELIGVVSGVRRTDKDGKFHLNINAGIEYNISTDYKRR